MIPVYWDNGRPLKGDDTYKHSIASLSPGLNLVTVLWLCKEMSWGGGYVLKYLRVKGHNVRNLLSNGSENIHACERKRKRKQTQQNVKYR